MWRQITRSGLGWIAVVLASFDREYYSAELGALRLLHVQKESAAGDRSERLRPVALSQLRFDLHGLYWEDP